MPFRLGVEEDLVLADRQSLALAPVTERGLTTAPSSAAHLKGELSDGVIELATEIVAGDSDAVAHPDRAA
jgi:gamma-glutamyl:cysteine ligase YbdK (ATP-grasp superfamily)